MPMRRFGACLAVLLFASAGWAEPAGQGVLLRYRFQAGQTQAVRLASEQDLAVTSSLEPGVVHRLVSRIRVDTRQTVRAVGVEGAVLEVTFGQPQGEVISQGVEMPLSGAEDLARLKLLLRMDERGRMSEVQPLLTPELSPEVQKLAAELKKNLTQNAVVFPERPLAPGESWSEERLVPSEMPGAEKVKMVVKTTYTFRGLETLRGEGVARIESQVLMGLEGQVEQGGVPVVASLQGRGQGVALFSPASGRMVRSSASLELAGSLRASQGETSVETGLKLSAKLTLETP